MSTDREVSKRRLSRSEGTGIESDTVNLCEQQKHQHHQQQKQQYKELASTTNQTTLLSPSLLSLSQPKWGGKTAQDEENEDDSNILAQASKATITIEGETAATVTATTESVATSGSDGPRQVIAVSANKNPTAFFQLARKFLMTNEMCDLSALEGAIVSAVDAAHLLERSQLASIVRIHTSYVNVEPKRRRQVSQKRQQQQQQCEVSTAATSVTATEKHVPPIGDSASSSDHLESISLNTIHAVSLSTAVNSPNKSSVSVNSSNARQGGPSRGSFGGRELRRARILVTVKRTESYKRWLDENPLHRQAIIADEDISDSNVIAVTGPPKSYHSQEESQK
mmetsp:Transcript_62202/g.69610  ORF Transcript_62202/g.69610 Transcript_62202/m.69610 type:complete len:338 (+) Transcript_62202:249-1262(+)